MTQTTVPRVVTNIACECSRGVWSEEQLNAVANALFSNGYLRDAGRLWNASAMGIAEAAPYLEEVYLSC